MKFATKYTALAIAAVLVVAIGIAFAVSIYSKTTADTRGKTEQREDTVADGSYRIAAYDHFYDLCAAVQTTEGRIAALEDEKAGDPSESRLAQIEVTLTALRGQRIEAINEYNADARKEATAAQFKASDLPDQLDPSEEKTTCTAE